MDQLQLKVANKIFPTVAERLNAQTAEFGAFIEKFRTHLNALSNTAEEIKLRIEIGGDFTLSMATELEAFLEKTLSSLQDLIAGEELQIVALLESFVDENVEEKISDARRKVAGVWGRGTTASQTAEVRAFYKEVKTILSDALRGHVLNRFSEFSTYLYQQATDLPDRALGEVNAEIERATADIRAAAEAAIAGQKEAFEKMAEALNAEVSKAIDELALLLDSEKSHTDSARSDGLAAPSEPAINSGLASDAQKPKLVGVRLGKANPDEIRADANLCLARFTLKNGATHWSFERIFTQDFLVGATELWLTDPFLASPHQHRNFREFVAAVSAVTKLKLIHVVTKMSDSAGIERVENLFRNFDQGLYEQVGTRLSISYSEDIHDRFAVFDNGIVFKLGRGLDIYKPATGLASVNPKLRKVRDCEVDVFGPRATD